MGIFFAPLIIVFALSGALQTFRLQESPKGSSYAPPAWIVKLADIHKDQRAAHEPGRRRSLPMQWFVVVMSVGLISTSLLGIYMAFKYRYDKRMVTALIILGTVIPLALLYL